MAVMLVMVIFWDKHAAQTTFDDVASRQEAQVERKVAQAENKAVPVSAAPAAAGAAQVTVETAPEVVADSSSIAAAPNKAKMAAQQQVTSLSKQLKMPVTAAPAVDVAPPLAAVNQPEVAAAQAPSPSSRKMESAEASAGRRGDMKKLDAEKSASGPAQQMDEIADARSRGAANAVADIKVGNLRILTLAIKSEAVDSATGYRIEVVANRPETAALQAELESYNHAMRDWYAKSIQN